MVVTVAASLVPGANAWLGGQRRLAVVVAVGTLAAIGSAIVLIRVAGGLLHTVVSPVALAGLGALNLVILALRLEELRRVRRGTGSHVLQRPQHRLRRPARVRLRRARRVAILFSVPLIAVPHLVTTLQLEAVRGTIVDAFDPVAAQPAPDQTPIPPTSTTDVPRPVDLPVARSEKDPPATALPQTADGTVDILLIGLDAGAGRVGARNDANLIVSIDTQTAEVTLIGVPRNFVQLPFPRSDDDCRCYRPPLYSLYGYGHENAADVAPADDPGAEAVREALSALIGRTIEWYVVADLAGFRHVVDAAGGIDVEVSEPVRSTFTDPEDVGERISVDIGPGQHHLDGSQALAYARTRADSDDYRRMERQRCLLASASQSAHEVTAADAVRLLATTRGEVSSSIPRDALAALVDLVQEVDTDGIGSIGLVPPDYVSGWSDGYPVPDQAEIWNALQVSGDEQQDRTAATSEC